MDQIGRFQISGKLGRGAFGMVYRGRDPVINRDAAIKVMSEATVGDPELVARFKREAEAAGGLNHRNIVTIYDLGEHNGLPYIAMEFLEGKDLERILKERVELTFDRKIDIVAQTAEGLHYAHTKGIVHRDIKPGNIRLLEDGTVKIMDFGIAKMSSSDMTKTGQFMGTVNYMSPEQIKAKKIDGRADLFALGIVFYELMSGRRPFPGDSITAVIYKIVNENPAPLSELHGTPYDWLEGVIMKCLEKDANKRWASCQELVEALRAHARVGGSLEASPIQKTLAVVQQRVEAGDFDSAIRKLDEILEEDPDNALAARERKEIQTQVAIKEVEPLVASGRLDQARDHLLMAMTELGETEALAKAVKGVEAKIKIARVEQMLLDAQRYLQEKRIDAAVDLLRQARDIDPYNEKVRSALGHANDEKRRADVELLLGDARARLEGGHADEARGRVQKALELDPHSLDAKALQQQVERELDLVRRKGSLQQELAQAAAAVKRADYDLAIEHLQRALGLDPKNEEARRRLEEAKQEKLKAEERTAVLELIEKGRGLLKERRFDEARVAFQQALRLDPSWGDAKLGMEASGSRRTTLEVTSRKAVPVPALVGAAVAVLAALAIGGWLMTRPSEAARALGQGKAALAQNSLAEAKQSFYSAAEAPGKAAEHAQAREAYCALYPQLARSQDLILDAKSVLEQCRTWKIDEASATSRFRELGQSLGRRGLETGDPSLLKGASASYQSSFTQGYDKGRDYEAMKELYLFGQNMVEKAEDPRLDAARRLEIYSAAQDVFGFVDKNEVSLPAFEDMNRARAKRTELAELKTRIDAYNAERDRLVADAAQAEKDQATWERAIQDYDQLLKLVARNEDLAEQLGLAKDKDLAQSSKSGLEQRRSARVAAASQEQKVALLLEQARSLEQGHDLRGAIAAYQELLKQEPGQGTATAKVQELRAALTRVEGLKGEIKSAIAARNLEAADARIKEALALSSDQELVGLQAEFDRLKKGAEAEAAVAEKFTRADDLLKTGQLDQAEAAYKEIAGATSGKLLDRANDGIRQVAAARDKAQIEPLLAQADGLKGQGKTSEALEELKKAQRINARYPGLAERFADLQKPLIDEMAAKLWPAYQARDRDPAAFDKVTRDLKELQPSHPELALVQGLQRASGAIAALDPGGAVRALGGLPAADPRVKSVRDQTEALQAVTASLEQADRQIAARNRDEATRRAEEALQGAQKLGIPAAVTRAEDAVKRARAVVVESVAAATPPPVAATPVPVAATPVPVAVATPPPSTPPPVVVVESLGPRIQQAVVAGNWREAAGLVEKQVGGGGSVDPALGARVFFNASHSAVCDGGCDLDSGRRWAERAAGYDASVKRWSSTLVRFKTCDVNLQAACRALPKR